MKKQSILVLAYSDINYDSRIMKQCLALNDGGYEVCYHGVKYGEVNHVNPFKTFLYFKRSSSKKKQYVQYFILMLIFFFVQFRFLFKKPIVIVHNMPNFLVFSSFFFRLFGTKIVLDIHDDSVLVFSQTVKNKFLLFMLDKIENVLSLKMPNYLMTVNRVIAMELEEKTFKKVLTLHNSPIKRTIKPCNRYIHGTPIKLVYVGNIGSHYGLESFIEYVFKLKELIPLTLDIYGDGASKSGLELIVDELNLNETVRFHGRYVVSELEEILEGYHLGVAMYKQNELTDIILPVKILEYTFNSLPAMTVPLKVTNEYFGEDSLVYIDSYMAFKVAMVAIYNNEINLNKVHEKALSDISEISWENERSFFLDYIEGLK